MRVVKNKVQRCPRNWTTETSSLVTSRLFPFGVTTNGIHSTRLCCHISSRPQSTCHLFLCSQGWLLNLHKHPLALVNLHNQMNPNLCPLFCLHIQHTGLFKWRKLIGLPEVAGCSFCLSILLQYSLIFFRSFLYLRILKRLFLHLMSL